MKESATTYETGKTDDLARWRAKGRRFELACDFLQREGLATLPAGRYELGDGVYAMVQECDLKPVTGGVMRAEVHSRYIDIQAPLDGPEVFGIREIDSRFEPFDEVKDVGFGEVEVEKIVLQSGDFAVFYPNHGAHAPCRMEGENPCRRRKVVIKILAE